MKPCPSSPGRLTRDSQYRQVYKEGKLARGETLRLYLLPAPGAETMLGVSISSSVIKKAARRNRLKRVIKEWFRHNKDEAAASCQAVVVVKKDTPVTGGGRRRIRQELTGLFKEASKKA